ncbi:hypothetical protein FACS189499_10660 [Clostridia bacterium]|nr:hypothetical protein FACS189499_10660 [Clostridia bacterium]
MVCGVAISIIITAFVSFAAACDRLPDTVLRLHILANSDLEADQNVKYRLRDFLLTEYGDVFSASPDTLSAKNTAIAALPEIVTKSEEFLQSIGCDYPVTAAVENIYFTTRSYGTVTLPAGNYDALRIKIGAGNGRNWWCVMFPPLCLPAAAADAADADETLPAYFTAEESRRIEDGKGIQPRFAVYEWLKKMTSSS